MTEYVPSLSMMHKRLEELEQRVSKLEEGSQPQTAPVDEDENEEEEHAQRKPRRR